MNILWLSHLIPYPPTGIGALQRSHNLLKEISKQHDVYLISFIQNSLLENAFGTVSQGLHIAREALLEHCKYVEFIEIPCERHFYGKHMLAAMCLLSSMPYSIKWLWSSKYADTAARLSRDIAFDIAHYDTISLAEYRGHIISRRHVLNHHNIESHMMLRRAFHEKNILKKSYFYLEGRKLSRYEADHCKLFDLQLTCSELDSNRLRTLDSSTPIVEIQNGVDTRYFMAGEKAGDEPQLVFAGSLDWYPNADAMLFFADRIWPVIKSKRPDVVMNLIGRNPPKALVELSEADLNFRVHGFVDDVRPYINNSDVYVCPIRDGGGTKLKILDAFAMSKAVVAHPVACEGISATDGEHAIFATDPTDFAEKVILLLDDYELRRKIGTNARRLVEDCYSYQNIGQRLTSLYEALANGPA